MVTKERALEAIKEIAEYLDAYYETPGYKDDEIFLLSTGEYEKYKDNIPQWKSWWWLRSPGDSNTHAANVSYTGSIDYDGRNVYADFICVRPALKLNYFELSVGERIIKYNFPWIYIGDGLCIAEIPIAMERFDNESDNNYQTSHIRKFLNDWKKNR